MIIALIILVVLLSLTFIYTDGFQDGSSVTASAICCRALSPVQAIALVAVCEVLGAMLGGSAVANTIRSVTNWPDRLDLLPVLSSGLTAAVLWNFITRMVRLPSSSTHALVGGVLGAIWASGGFKYIVWGTLKGCTGVWKVIVSLFISPLAGFIGGFVIFSAMLLLLSGARMSINRVLKRLQWLTLALLAFSHGVNDSQKAMGVIILALYATGGHHGTGIPVWVRALTGVFIALGVASLVPGIVRRVGSDIYKLRPVHGLAVQLGSISVLLTASLIGGPVSATQVISSTVMGVGTADRRKGVHWLVAKDMLVAWFITIPGAGILAWLVYATAFVWIQKWL